MSHRRIGLLSLLGVAVITVLVAALLLTGLTSHAEAASPVAPSSTTWTYQKMSTSTSTDNPYLGSPQQQWLVAAALAAGLSAAAVARRQLQRSRVRVSGT